MLISVPARRPNNKWITRRPQVQWPNVHGMRKRGHRHQLVRIRIRPKASNKAITTR
jgi:hypothetical protein